MEGFHDRNIRAFDNVSSPYWLANVSDSDNYLYKFKQQQVKRDCPYIDGGAIHKLHYPRFNIPQTEASAEMNGAWFSIPQKKKQRKVVAGFPLSMNPVTFDNCQTCAGKSRGPLLAPRNAYAMPAGGYKRDKFWDMSPNENIQDMTYYIRVVNR